MRLFMEVSVLGKYGPYPTPEGATSGYLLKTSGGLFALDMGSGVFSRLSGICPPEKLNAVFISHFHYDHVADLGILNYYLEALARKGLFNAKMPVYIPKVDCPASDEIKEMKYFDVRTVEDGDTVTLNGAKFTFFLTAHPVYCLGVAVVSRKEKFVYSADGDLSKNLEENLKGSTLAVLDGAFLSKNYAEGKPHMSVYLCGALSEKFGVKTVVSHLIPTNPTYAAIKELSEFPSAYLAEEGKTYFSVK